VTGEPLESSMDEEDDETILDDLNGYGANSGVPIGDDFQVDLPADSEAASENSDAANSENSDREGSLVWSPDCLEEDASALDAYLAAAQRRLADQRLKFVWPEFALRTLFEQAGNTKVALGVLQLEEDIAKSSLWNAAETEDLATALGRGGRDLKLVQQCLHSTQRTFPEIVAQAYLTYPTIDEKATSHRPPRPPRPAAGQRAQSERSALAPSVTFSTLMNHGLLEAGRAVLSIDLNDQLLLADLLPCGAIRYHPADGSAPQQFRTPQAFARAMRVQVGVSGACDAWKMVEYKGVKLELLRDASVCDGAALAAVAAQDSLSATRHYADSAAEGGRSSSGSNNSTARSPPKQAATDTSPPKQAATATSTLLHTLHKSWLLEQDVNRAAQRNDCAKCEQVRGKSHDCSRSGPSARGASSKPKAADAKPKVADATPKAADATPKAADLAADSKPKVADAKPKAADAKPTAADAKPRTFEVEAILNKRPAKKGNGFEYLIKWEGFNGWHNSWQPRDNLLCEDLLDAFEARLKGQEQPAARQSKPAPWTAVPHGDAAAKQVRKTAACDDSVPAKRPRLEASLPASSATAPSMLVARMRSLEEIDEQERGCECRESCELASLLAAGVLEPGENVLSVYYKGELSFADVLEDGRIRIASADGSPLTLAAPCNLLRLLYRRWDVKAKLRPLSDVAYKGVALSQLRSNGRARRRPTGS